MNPAPVLSSGCSNSVRDSDLSSGRTPTDLSLLVNSAGCCRGRTLRRGQTLPPGLPLTLPRFPSARSRAARMMPVAVSTRSAARTPLALFIIRFQKTQKVRRASCETPCLCYAAAGQRSIAINQSAFDSTSETRDPVYNCRTPVLTFPSHSFRISGKWGMGTQAVSPRVKMTPCIS